MAVKSSFNEAKDAINALEWKPDDVRRYAESLSVLTSRQRELIEKTKNLSDTQILQLENEVALIRNEKIRAAAEKAGITSSQQRILIDRLSTSSVDKLTGKILKQAAADAELTDEQKKYFVNAMLGKSANDQLAFSFETLKANALAAGQAMLMNPVTGVSRLLLWFPFSQVHGRKQSRKPRKLGKRRLRRRKRLTSSENRWQT